MNTYQGEVMPDDFKIPEQKLQPGLTFVQDDYFVRTARYIVTALSFDVPLLVFGLVMITASHMMLTAPLQGVLENPRIYLGIIDAIFVLTPLGFMFTLGLPIAMSVPLLAGYAYLWLR